MSRKLALTLAALGGLVGADGATLVYEGFDYPAGQNVLTPLNGGTGFAEAWRRAQEGSNDSITVATGVPTGGTGNLDGVFNNPAVTTAGNHIDGATGDDRLTANRILSQSAGTLAGADKVLWASVIWTMNGSNFGRQVGFTLGTDGLTNRSQNVSTNTTWGGSGAGHAIGVGGAINTAAVTPTIWAGGSQVIRTTTGAKTLSFTQDHIVILKFVFADGSTPDTVSAWAFGETETINEATFNTNAISASAVIDQDTLNVLSFGQSQVSIETIDEIRLGDTFADVTLGLGVPPQPFAITVFSYNQSQQQATLTWRSNPGQTYGIYWSPDLTDFSGFIAPAVPANASEPLTAYGPFAVPDPGADRMFFRIGPPDLEAPTLSRTSGSGSTITLAFSEPMAAAPATLPSNYVVTLNGGGSVGISAAVLSSDGLTVTLTTSAPLALASQYTVAISNLTDLAERSLGNPAIGSFQTWDNDPNGIKVFILAGQSNMVGYGKTEQGGNPAWTPTNGEPKEIVGGLGCLRYLANNNASFPEYDYTSLLVDPGNPATSAWAARGDVKVWFKDGYVTDPRTIRKGNLGPPFLGASNGGGSWFGPEYAFGRVIGDHFGGSAEQPVLIIKTSWGGIDLGAGFRPPSAVAARGGVVGPYYTAMIDDAREVLANLATEFPAAQHPEFNAVGYRYQIAGIGWHQGWNDSGEPFASEYKNNLPDLIGDLRAEFGNPNLPFAIASTGMGGNKPVEPAPYTGYSKVEQAQLWVAGVAQPVKVLSTDTRPFWRDAAISPSTLNYHWNHNAESYFLVGKSLGDNMVNLLTP